MRKILPVVTVNLIYRKIETRDNPVSEVNEPRTGYIVNRDAKSHSSFAAVACW